MWKRLLTDTSLIPQGRPFQAQLEDLAIGGQDDPVVRAALAALPQRLADEVCSSWTAKTLRNLSFCSFETHLRQNHQDSRSRTTLAALSQRLAEEISSFCRIPDIALPRC